MTFSIIRSKGFHMTFPNGWTISVQFGIGNYCGKYPYDRRDYDAPRNADKWQSPDAEVAIWHSLNGIEMFDPDGWQTSTQVADLITILSSDPAPFYHGA